MESTYLSASNFRRTRLWQLVILICLGCIDEESIERNYPSVILDRISEISSNGSRFNANIVKGPIEEIIETGFTWDIDDPVSNFDDASQVVVSYSPRQRFSKLVSSQLLPGSVYKVRAYVKTSKVTVFSNVESFKSQGAPPPLITAILPENAKIGDTIRIVGKNFASKNKDNIVQIDKYFSKVVNSNDTAIDVVIPFLTTRAPDVQVIVTNQSGIKSNLLKVNAPFINKILTQPRICESFSIKIENFPPQTVPKLELNQISTPFNVLAPESVISFDLARGLTSPVILTLTWYDTFSHDAASFNIEYPIITSSNSMSANSSDHTFALSYDITCLSNVKVFFTCNNERVESEILELTDALIKVKTPRFIRCLENELEFSMEANQAQIMSTKISYSP